MQDCVVAVSREWVLGSHSAGYVIDFVRDIDSTLSVYCFNMQFVSDRGML